MYGIARFVQQSSRSSIVRSTRSYGVICIGVLVWLEERAVAFVYQRSGPLISMTPSAAIGSIESGKLGVPVPHN